MLVVDTTVTDKSSGTATAVVKSATIQGLQKVNGPIWDNLGDLVQFAIDAGTTETVKIPLCIAGYDLDLNPALLPESKSVNALISVSIGEDGSKDEYISRCQDDPATEDVNEAILKVANYPTLCNL